MNQILSLSSSVLLLCITLNVKGELKEYVNNNILDRSQPQPINLTCSLGEFIHVVRTEFRHCSTGEFAESCSSQQLAARTRYLASLCVGKQTCFESVKLSVPTTPTGVTVYYECIGVNRFSLCDRSVSSAVYTEPIHLNSYSYPVSRAVGQRCRCNVNGNNMKATIYDLDINNKGGNFSMKGDGRTASLSRLKDLYNDDIFIGVDSLDISYYDGGADNQNVWINVAGTGQMTVSCDQESIVNPTTRATSVRPPSTSTLRATLSTSPPSTPPLTDSQTTRTTTIATSVPSSSMSITAVPVTSRQPLTYTGTASTTTLVSSAPVNASSTPSVTPSRTTSIPETYGIIAFSSVSIGILCGAILFFLIMIPVVVLITIKCVKRSKRLNLMKQNASSNQPVVPPRQLGYQYPSPQYLELMNTNNTYNQLYDTEPRDQQEYTQLHIYETFPDSRPQSSQFQH